VIGNYPLSYPYNHLLTRSLTQSSESLCASANPPVKYMPVLRTICFNNGVILVLPCVQSVTALEFK
jgi:hypothetical protein